MNIQVMYLYQRSGEISVSAVWWFQYSCAPHAGIVSREVTQVGLLRGCYNLYYYYMCASDTRLHPRRLEAPAQHWVCGFVDCKT